MRAIGRIGARRRQFCLLSFVFLVVATSEAAHAISTAPTWRTPETIGSPVFSYDNQRGDRFLAFDHYGVPSVVAVRDTGGVNFARQVDGINWIASSIGGVGAKHASLAFDRHELPGIAYGDSGGLHYVYYSTATSSFQNNLVDNTAVSGRDWTLGTGIAFDVYGRPAIAASEDDGAFGELHFIRDTNLDGVISSADTRELVSSNPEQFPSLVFDSQNRPGIAARYLGGGTNGDLDVYVKDPFVGWQLKIVASNAEEGTPDAVIGSMAIDPTDGLPAVAWTHWTGAVSELWYAKWNQLENQWDSTVVTSDAANQMGNESLAFDPSDGRPAIAYGDNSGDLNFAWFDGAAWNTQVANSTGTAFAPRSSLAFNEFGHGFPAIAYITNTGLGNGNLRFIVDPPDLVPEPGTLVLCAISFAIAAATRRRGASAARSPRV